MVEGNLQITDLPNEVCRMIFLCLEIKDLGKCAQVCRLWNKLISDDAIWKPFLNSYTFLNGKKNIKNLVKLELNSLHEI